MTSEDPGLASYEDWNQIIADAVFKEDRAGRVVFMYFTEESIDELGKPLGQGISHFLRAVHQGRPEQVARRTLELAANWRKRRATSNTPPPYLACLAMFVAAAAAEEPDLADHNYYTRLWRLLDTENRSVAPVGFRQLSEKVWDDLEVWSSQDMDGRFGVFRKRVFGEMRHVGIPRFQALLTEHELFGLPGIFQEAELDPASNHTDLTLSRVLTRFGSGLLSARTRSTLAKKFDDPLRVALLDVVHDELENWDGRIGTGGSKNVGGTTFLRLCLEPRGHGFRCVARCHVPLTTEFPHMGLEFALQGCPANLRAEGLGSNWSTRVLGVGEDELFDPTTLDWSRSHRVASVSDAWTVVLPSPSVRVFQDGRSHGLPGFVEIDRLPREGPCFVAVQEEKSPAIDRWITAGGGEADIVSGSFLPSGWILYRVAQVEDTNALEQIHPSLGWTRANRIRLVGGLRVGRGDRFVASNPPEIAIVGPIAGMTPLCDCAELENSGPGLFRFSGKLPRGKMLTVELLRESDGETMARQRLVLEEEIPLGQVEPLLSLGPDGRPSEGSTNACGGSVALDASRRRSYELRLPFPRSGNVTLLGKIPGQYSKWPNEVLPDWKPVWIVGAGRRRKPLTFVGQLGLAEPVSGVFAGDSLSRKRWKAAIWGDRKKVESPTHPELATLWTRYIDFARPPR